MKQNTTQTYYFITLAPGSSLSLADIDTISQLAMESYSCGGIEEFSIDNDKVDEILGDRSYCPGDVPPEFLTEVEDYLGDHGEKHYKLFFYEESAEKNAQDFFDYLQKNYCEANAQIQKADYEDWDAQWRSHYHPIEVSSRLTVVPSWQKEEHDQKTGLFIYPGKGFGTGGHETTYLCLKLTDTLAARGVKVHRSLDYGCGSGILGLAVRKLLHAESIDLYDIDEEAMDNCAQNIAWNFESTEDVNSLHMIHPHEHVKLENKQYDLVLANILINVLKAEREFLVKSMASGAHLILSGLLNEQVEDVKSTYLQDAQLELVEHISKGDWAALMFQKRK